MVKIKSQNMVFDNGALDMAMNVEYQNPLIEL